MAASQAGQLVDLAAARAMLDEHRTGSAITAAGCGRVLIFMLWHAIFVEGSIVPVISEPTYPVQL